MGNIDIREYEGPFFCRNTRILDYIFGTFYQRGSIKSRSQNIDGFRGIRCLFETGWLVGSRFISSCNEEIIVAFPWCPGVHDFIGEETLKTIAVFKKNESSNFCGCVLSDMIKAFWEEYCSNPVKGDSIPDEIFYIINEKGEKEIPRWYIKDRAYLNPVNGGDPFLSWLAAENWFKSQGFVIVDLGNFPKSTFFIFSKNMLELLLE